MNIYTKKRMKELKARVSMSSIALLSTLLISLPVFASSTSAQSNHLSFKAEDALSIEYKSHHVKHIQNYKKSKKKWNHHVSEDSDSSDKGNNHDWPFF